MAFSLRKYRFELRTDESIGGTMCQIITLLCLKALFVACNQVLTQPIPNPLPLQSVNGK
jgi:hypothetical protein